MSDPKMPAEPSGAERDVARRKAQNLFSTHDERTALVKEMVAKENAASDLKTARLRALRLAKEAADEKEALAHPPHLAKKPARRRIVRVGK